MIPFGVVYVVYGDQARRAAEASIVSLKQQYDAVPILVIGEWVKGATQLKAFDDEDSKGRWAKTNLDKLTDFDMTVYLDADTLVRQSIWPLFEVLEDGVEFVVAHSKEQEGSWMWHLTEEESTETLALLGNCLVLQGGVFGFRRCPHVTRLFGAWRHEWLRWRDVDQGALVRALHRCPTKLWLLGRPWNGGAIVDHRFGLISR